MLSFVMCVGWQIRFLSVAGKQDLGEVTDLNIKIHVDKENKVLHITDTGRQPRPAHTCSPTRRRPASYACALSASCLAMRRALPDRQAVADPH